MLSLVLVLVSHYSCQNYSDQFEWYILFFNSLWQRATYSGCGMVSFTVDFITRCSTTRHIILLLSFLHHLHHLIIIWWLWAGTTTTTCPATYLVLDLTVCSIIQTPISIRIHSVRLDPLSITTILHLTWLTSFRESRRITTRWRNHRSTLLVCALSSTSERVHPADSSTIMEATVVHSLPGLTIIITTSRKDGRERGRWRRPLLHRPPLFLPATPIIPEMFIQLARSRPSVVHLLTLVWDNSAQN